MISVPLCRLLWSSRGKAWGFRFLLYPSEVRDRDFWLAVHDRTFGTSAEVPLYFQGLLELPNGSSVPYLAARLYDAGHEWRDDSGGRGREIPHELLLLVDAAQKQRLSESNWPHAVMDALRPVYAELYSISPAEIVRCGKLEALATQEVVIGGPSQLGSRFPPVETAVPLATDARRAPEQSPKTKVPITFISAVIAMAVLLGLAGIALILQSGKWPF